MSLSIGGTCERASQLDISKASIAQETPTAALFQSKSTWHRSPIYSSMAFTNKLSIASSISTPQAARALSCIARVPAARPLGLGPR